MEKKKEKKERENRSETLGLRGDTASRGREADAQASSAFSYLNDPRRKRTTSALRPGRGNAGGGLIAAAEEGTQTRDGCSGNAREARPSPKLRRKKRRNQAACLHRYACSCPLRSLKLHIHMALNTRKSFFRRCLADDFKTPHLSWRCTSVLHSAVRPTGGSVLAIYDSIKKKKDNHAQT